MDTSSTLKLCEVCAAPSKLSCGACKSVYYCGPEHQRQDWKSLFGGHKHLCKTLQKRRARRLAAGAAAEAASAEVADNSGQGNTENDERENEDEEKAEEIRNKVLIVGAAGVGKTRVIQELIGPGDLEASGEAVSRSYGPAREGHTSVLLQGMKFWPYSVETKYYRATLDLWEVNHTSLLDSIQTSDASSNTVLEEKEVRAKVKASVRELLQDAQALVLVFDTGNPESFESLELWGETLLELQRESSSGHGPGRGSENGPEVCLCMGNEPRQHRSHLALQRMKERANLWSIDHGMEFVPMSYAPGAIAPRSVECRRLLHDLEDSMEGTARLVEALHCNMWRGLTLHPTPLKPGSFLGSQQQENSGAENGRGGGLLDSLLAQLDSSNTYQSFGETEVTETPPSSSPQVFDMDAFEQSTTDGHDDGFARIDDDDGDDDWFETSEHPVIATDRLPAFDPADYEQLLSGPEDDGDGDDGDGDAEDDPFARFAEARFEDLMADAAADDRTARETEEKTEAAAEEDRAFMADGSSPANGVASVEEAEQPSEEEEEEEKEVNGTPTRDEDEAEEEEQEQDGTAAAAAAASLTQGDTDDGVNEKTDDEVDEAEDGVDVDPDKWERLVEKIQRTVRAAPHLPDEVRRRNAEEGLMSILQELGGLENL